MEAVYTLNGLTEDDIWLQIKADVAQADEFFAYRALINQNGLQVLLDVDIDLGGGFESGYALTTLSAQLKTNHQFRFAVHEEHFIDEIGKFLGMQDIDTGYAELDKHLIIKSNHPHEVKQLFVNPQVRQVFQQLKNFTLGIHHHRPEGAMQHQAYLELIIEDGITDLTLLRSIYHAFMLVLQQVESFG